MNEQDRLAKIEGARRIARVRLNDILNADRFPNPARQIPFEQVEKMGYFSEGILFERR